MYARATHKLTVQYMQDTVQHSIGFKLAVACIGAGGFVAPL